MKKIFILILLFLILLLVGCGDVKSDEEIHQDILDKMSWDIHDFQISDYYIETDENMPLQVSKVDDVVFNDLCDTIESEGRLGDGHFFLSWLPAWSEYLYFRNIVIDPENEIDEMNNSNNYYCIFENEHSVKLYIFFYETGGVWQSCGFYINPEFSKYENPATDWSPCIQQIDK